MGALMKRGTLTLRCAVTAMLALAGVGLAFATPDIGYVYPAGGQQGTTFTIEVGGQSLGEVDHVHVSGRGVNAAVIEHARELDRRELRAARSFLRDLVRRQWVGSAMQQAASGDPLPDHPWLRDLDEKTPLELERVRRRFFDPKAQPDAQIAEQLLVEVTVAPNATPGDRELRVASPDGLSNALCFQVGVLPELVEEQFAPPESPTARVVEPPVLLNGQILPGEVDRIRLRARRGQRLVIDLQARALIPYLADAVPGWFQATMALYDPGGREVAFCDDYRFDPDPVILYEVPADGVYTLEVRDAIYRGREDFVYRISIGELPFVTSIFPLGGREGEETVATISGWNLPSETLRLDTRPGGPALRKARVGGDGGYAATVRYAVDSLPEVAEVEPNDSVTEAQKVSLPAIVNGRIDRPGDTDVFSFEGRAGEEIVAEVYARRLGSPLDSVLRLVGPGGDVIAFNDDHKDPAWGLVTHHADSYIRTELPQTGTYAIVLFDALRDGGEEYAYRLHLRPAQPDYALRLVPSSVNVRSGRSATVTVHAMRRDGFDGAIDLALGEAPEGFALAEARVPEGEDTVETTLSVARGAQRQIAPIALEGRAQIGGGTVTRPVVPAEDQMQAFLWRFIVPKQELLVAVGGSRPVPAVWQPLAEGFELSDEASVRIPLGGTARVHVNARQVLPDGAQTPLEAVGFRLANRPRGVTLRDFAVTSTGVTLTLKADANIAMTGDRANAIVEAFTYPAADAGSEVHGGRVSLGVLPAIPFEVVLP